MKRGILVFLLIVGIFLSPLFADASLQGLKFTDARMLAMGGVQGPNAEGVSALFMNPAGIVRDNEIRLLTLGGGANAPLDPELIDAATTYAQGFDGSFDEDPTELLSHADFSGGVGLMDSYTLGITYFGLGVGLGFSSDFQVVQSTPESDARLQYQSCLAIAGGGSFRIPLGNNSLYIGGNVKRIYQGMVTESVPTDNVISLLGNDEFSPSLPAVLGAGTGFDAGIIYDANPFVLESECQGYRGNET